MSKQSSVDWLLEQLNNKRLGNYEIDIPKNVIETAKEMYKQEIVEHHTWLLSGVMPEESARKDGEDYYNQTFEQ